MSAVYDFKGIADRLKSPNERSKHERLPDSIQKQKTYPAPIFPEADEPAPKKDATAPFGIVEIAKRRSELAVKSAQYTPLDIDIVKTRDRLEADAKSPFKVLNSLVFKNGETIQEGDPQVDVVHKLNLLLVELCRLKGIDVEP